MQKILVTGGCGFIGSHFVRLVLAETELEVVNLDALTYAGRPENLADVAGNPRYQFVHGSILDAELTKKLASEVGAIVHFAAESHVDNSIARPASFAETNMLGTQILLDAARAAGLKRFVHVSTDEVYGALELDSPARFTEDSPLAPNSPYSASKAGSDLLVRAAWRTHGLPAIITRCSNNYGTHQLPEKFLPRAILAAAASQPIPIYGDGKNIRDWVHVEDHCRAVLEVLKNGQPGEIYNIGSDNEVANLDAAKLILRLLGQPEDLIQFVPDRPGHDRRYAIDSAKIARELGWQPRRTDFEKELKLMIDWYLKQAR